MEWKASPCSQPNANPSKECTALYNSIQAMIGPFDPDNNWTDLLTGTCVTCTAATPLAPRSLLLSVLLRLPARQLVTGRWSDWAQH